MNSSKSENNLNKGQIDHLQILRDKVFEIDKYPSFSLLLDGVEYILKTLDKENKNICLLERTKLYGSSLFGGLFRNANVISFDCSPSSAKDRGSYNNFMINHNNFITYKNISELKQDLTFNLPANEYDAIFIPNLVHHFKNQNDLFSNCYKSLKNFGELIIFEPTIREIHQSPHDYIRYTPYGMQQIFKDYHLKEIKCKEQGDSFEALNYILNVMQAKREDKDFSDWCNQIKSKIDNFKEGKKDIVKDHARFPTSFLCQGIKQI
tara:strand:+ start:166 stop:957 length:792 start_codon:yes stop_codon:yes gene_type:complete